METAENNPNPNPNPNTETNPAPKDSSQQIVLGPIIGKVTSDVARVLVEFNLNGTETLSLVGPDGKKIDCQRTVTAQRPAIFVFTGLKPCTLYKVTSGYRFPAGDSSFRTLDSKAAPTNFAFVSCNSRKSYEKYTDKNNLWGDIAKRATNKEIDYIIHFGDQIYCDFYNDVYDRCIELLKKTPQDQWSQIAEQVREMIRQEYRLTFGGRLEAIALANCPSIMQFDDHETRDDLGFRPCDMDPTTPDGFYIQQSRVTYYEYQRQLREDIDFTDIEKIKFEFHTHTLNNIGLFFLDYRGKTSWLRAPEDGQLGKLQWDALKSAFKPSGGDFENCEMAILISPLAFVMYSNGWTNLAGTLVDDAKENWEYKYEDEHIELMNLLDDWKTAKKGKRDLFIVGGDIHHAGHTDIYRDNRRAYSQVITSGICQEMPNQGILLFTKLSQLTQQDLKGGWSFSHHGWTLKNNYTLISVKRLNVPQYTVQVITSEPTGILGKEKAVAYDPTHTKTKSRCCTMF